MYTRIQRMATLIGYSGYRNPMTEEEALGKKERGRRSLTAESVGGCIKA